MTAAAAKARGLATAVKAPLGWRATCPTCRWSSKIGESAYKGEASSLARQHNGACHTGSRRRLENLINYKPSTECIAATISWPGGAHHLIIAGNRLLACANGSRA